MVQIQMTDWTFRRILNQRGMVADLATGSLRPRWGERFSLAPYWPLAWENGRHRNLQRQYSHGTMISSNGSQSNALIIHAASSKSPSCHAAISYARLPATRSIQECQLEASASLEPPGTGGVDYEP